MFKCNLCTAQETDFTKMLKLRANILVAVSISVKQQLLKAKGLIKAVNFDEPFFIVKRDESKV